VRGAATLVDVDLAAAFAVRGGVVPVDAEVAAAPAFVPRLGLIC
jgi:hypothetical protein